MTCRVLESGGGWLAMPLECDNPQAWGYTRKDAVDRLMVLRSTTPLPRCGRCHRRGCEPARHGDTPARPDRKKVDDQ